MKRGCWESGSNRPAASHSRNATRETLLDEVWGQQGPEAAPLGKRKSPKCRSVQSSKGPTLAYAKARNSAIKTGTFSAHATLQGIVFYIKSVQSIIGATDRRAAEHRSVCSDFFIILAVLNSMPKLRVSPYFGGFSRVLPSELPPSGRSWRPFGAMTRPPMTPRACARTASVVSSWPTSPAFRRARRAGGTARVIPAGSRSRTTGWTETKRRSRPSPQEHPRSRRRDRRENG